MLWSEYVFIPILWVLSNGLWTALWVEEAFRYLRSWWLVNCALNGGGISLPSLRFMMACELCFEWRRHFTIFYQFRDLLWTALRVRQNFITFVEFRHGLWTTLFVEETFHYLRSASWWLVNCALSGGDISLPYSVSWLLVSRALSEDWISLPLFNFVMACELRFERRRL